MKSKKQIYREFCKTNPHLPIFSKDWWLDAVCGTDNWDVCLVEKGEQVLASMPYYVKKRYGFTLINHPLLTQTLGPWIRPSNAKYSKSLGRQKDLMEELIAQIPRFDSFSQNWHYSNTNWLPFYWNGFSQTTRYTYVIEDLSDLEAIYSDFENSKRKNIKKAEAIVNVVFDISAHDFYENHKMTLAKQGSKIVYSKELFQKIYHEAYERDSAVTIAAFDRDGNLHAALFVVWDEESAYDLISTIDPEYRTFGAASLLVKEVIRYVSNKTKKFDFEGSMIESVERSFRMFGAVQKTYFNVHKTNSHILNLTKCFKNSLCG